MKACVLGSGAFGIALSHILVTNKIDTTIWTPIKEEYNALRSTRKSTKLKDYYLPKELKIINNFDNIEDNDLIVVAVPAFAFEDTIKKISNLINKKQVILIATKGIQQNTCLFLHEVYKNYCNNPYAIISGPTFAIDIVNNSQVGFSMGTRSKSADVTVRKCFENKNTKFRTTRDIIGLEICGSVKNVMAIASGILEGMQVTDSTRALFLTESMNDIKELINALGGKKQTILSFAGFGDILMTCTSKNSRNFSFGYLIGSNSSKEEIDHYKNSTTIEGLYTLKSINKLVRRRKVKMPIINLINDIVNGKKDKKELLIFLIKK